LFPGHKRLGGEDKRKHDLDDVTERRVVGVAVVVADNCQLTTAN
jgi:hypothetical protein